MSKNAIRKLRTAVLALILTGGTLLTASAGGCDASVGGVSKATSTDAARYLIDPRT